jgi:hypothetical protein
LLVPNCPQKVEGWQQNDGVVKISLKMVDETITFLSHMPSFAASISSCDADQDLCIYMKTNWRKRVRVERTDDTRGAARRF